MARMPGQPFIELPPITPAFLRFTTFEWCQVRYLFARELTRRAEPLGWVDAYKEADEVIQAIQQSGVPLAYGARPDEIVWSTMICAANTYAHMQADERARVRAELALGRPIWAVAVVIEEPNLCDRSVLDDPEYNPEPSCVPREPRLGILGFAAGALAFTGYMAILATFANGNGKKEPPRPRKRPAPRRAR